MTNNESFIPFLKRKDYVMVDNNLGRGSFGQTVLLRDPYIDELFVAKKFITDIPENREKYFENFVKEIKILYKLNNKNVVRIYNYYPYELEFTGYIIMEYIEGKTLDIFLTNYFEPTEILTLDNLFIQLIEAFVYIESQHIVHRDIREKNIMIDNNGLVKVIDFGIGKISYEINSTPDSLRSVINRCTLLPDEYHKREYTSQTDIFYLGELLNRLINASSVTGDFSFQHVLDKMFQTNPSNRYKTFLEVNEDILQNSSVQYIDEADKAIYQEFVYSVYHFIDKFVNEVQLEDNYYTLLTNIKTLLENNCFEDTILSRLVVSTLVKSKYTCRMYGNDCISLEIVQSFYEWMNSLTATKRTLVFNNIIYKLSLIPVDEELELPF